MNSGMGLPGFKKNADQNFVKHLFCASNKPENISTATEDKRCK